VTELIRNAVLHLSNEQPLVADLFALPTPQDTILICTNLRTASGKRPVFADHKESVFFFPLTHIRFVEIPPGSTLPALPAETGSASRDVDEPAEPDLEIDEDFLRRIREA
jgi:hypothetical protein